MDVKIVEFPPTRVAMLTHLGHPDKVNASAAKFIAWRRETGQSPIASSQTFGIARHDPQTTPPAQFRFDICGSVRQPIAENDVGVVNSEIHGGRCAVVRHQDRSTASRRACGIYSANGYPPAVRRRAIFRSSSST